MSVDLSFYKNKKVLVTGHTGFKGTWLCKMLVNFGAYVTGYSLEPPTSPALYSLSNVDNNINSIIGDIRDYDRLIKVFSEVQPEIVFHLAAQPIVRDAYKDPKYTYETNVMGTVNIMECVRLTRSVRSVVNVTTDKVYHNNEWCWGYREDDPLDGFDPYSNSKSCSELVTHSYKNSFFDNWNGLDGNRYLAVSTVRAGNVIGGGDFANDRIIPDCVRAVSSKNIIGVRNPFSTRPYQHVLDPLAVYLEIAEKQFYELGYSGYYNVGPDDCNCVTTGELVDLFCKEWGDEASWRNIEEFDSPHEANFLKLDCSRVKNKFGWKPKWNIEESVRRVCCFSKILLENGDISVEMDNEIREFFM